MQCDYFDAGRCRSCTLMGSPYRDQVADKAARAAAALEDAAPGLRWLEPVTGPEAHFRNKAKLVVAGRAGAPTFGILDAGGRGVDLRRCGLYEPGLAATFDPLHRVRLRARDRALRRPGPTRRAQAPHRHPLPRRRAPRALRRPLPRVRRPAALGPPRHHRRAAVGARRHGQRPAGAQGRPRGRHRGRPQRRQPPDDAPARGHPPARPPVVLPDQHPRSRRPSTRRPARGPTTSPPPPSSTSTAASAVSPCTSRRPGRQVVGVETSEEAVAAATAGAHLNGIGSPEVEFVAGDATRHRADATPDLVVVNPPRRGLGDDLTAWLDSGDARHLVYSSCHLGSLARDLAAMPSWRPVQARVFDMFPQTDPSRDGGPARASLRPEAVTGPPYSASMTFSIAAHDGDAWGVAVASKFVAVGSVVPAVRVGVGAVATQSLARWAYRDEVLDALSGGATVGDALAPPPPATTAGPCARWAPSAATARRPSPVTSASRGPAGGPPVTTTHRLRDPGQHPHRTRGRRRDGGRLPRGRRPSPRRAAPRGPPGRGRRRRGLPRPAERRAPRPLAPGAGYDACGVLADLRVDDHPEPHRARPAARAGVARLRRTRGRRPARGRPARRGGRACSRRSATPTGRGGDTLEQSLEAWMSAENLENRPSPDGIDARVLAELRSRPRSAADG